MLLKKIRALPPRAFTSIAHLPFGFAGLLVLVVGLVSRVGWVGGFGIGIFMVATAMSLGVRSVRRTIDMEKVIPVGHRRLLVWTVFGTVLSSLTAILVIGFVAVEAAVASPILLLVIVVELVSYLVLITLNSSGQPRPEHVESVGDPNVGSGFV